MGSSETQHEHVREQLRLRDVIVMAHSTDMHAVRKWQKQHVDVLGLPPAEN